MSDARPRAREPRLVDLLQLCNLTIAELEQRGNRQALLDEVRQLRRQTLDRIDVVQERRPFAAAPR